jgi:ATP-dependent Lhr-like helicase
LLVAAERLPEILAIHPAMVNFTAPHFRAQRTWTREEAMVEIVRGRMSLVGPITSHALAHSLDVTERECDQALTALEAEGCVLRGSFESTFESDATEWCDRRLLARIHRYTLHRLRAEIEPVTAAELMRFLFSWQHAVPSRRLAGADGLHSVIAALDGFEIAAAAWERFILPLRVDRYDPSLLDALSFRGDVAWLRLSPAGASSPIAATPVAICLREHVPAWLALRSAAPIALSEAAQTILEQLRQRGPSFARDLGGSGTEGSPRATIDGSLPTGAAIRAGIVNVGAHADDNVEANVKAIGELVAAGLISSDGFGGLRALIGTARDHRASGRWALVESIESPEAATERFALTLLQRYGVVFRRLLARESIAVPWRELARIYRRLEARGEIRGGRFVAGMSGEQFALPEAVTLMRETRREKQSGTLVVISAADPLNLVGVITSDERVRAIPSTRIAYRDGVALSVMEGDYLRPLAPADDAALEIAAALAGRRVPVASGFVGRSG